LQVAFADINIRESWSAYKFSKWHFSQSTAKEAGHEMQIQPKSRDRLMLRVSSRPVGRDRFVLHTKTAAADYATHLANRC